MKQGEKHKQNKKQQSSRMAALFEGIGRYTKQGDGYMKAAIVILMIMVACYVLYGLLDGGSSGARTVQAVLYSANEGVSAQGVIVRSERIIPADFSLNVYVKAEGERVAKDEEVAVSFMTQDAWVLHEEMDTLENELEQLKQALSYQSQLTDNAAVTEKLDQELAHYAAQVAGGELESAAETAGSIQALILRQNVGEDSQGQLIAQIAGLERELETLRGQSAYGAVSVTAPQPGYYSRTVDGYEALLTPEFLNTASPEALERVLSQGGSEVGKYNAGRLITSSAWYCAVPVEPEYLTDVKEGDRLAVDIAARDTLSLTMEVWRVDRAAGLLVLTSDRYMSEVSTLRNVGADIIFDSWSGLRVPKEAVCYDEEQGTAGVYVLVNQEAVWKPVTLIYDVGDAYIAELDQSSTKNLWPEDLILTETAGLFNGKVVN